MLKRCYYFLIIGLLFLGTWFGVLFNGFLIWDDDMYILKNLQIQNFDFEQAVWFLNHFSIANWHPLTLYSHALDYELFNTEAWGHHLHSLILHAINSLLVFGFSWQLFKILKQPHALIIAGIAAVGFSLHPQHVEVVAWASERKELLCFLFLISAAWTWLKYRQSQQFKYYIYSTLLFILALMSKPMAVTFPVLLIILDLLLIKVGQLPIKIQSVWLDKIPLLILSLLLIIATLLAQHQGGAISSLQTLGIGSRLLNATYNSWFYVEKWLLPIHLSPYYPYPEILIQTKYIFGALISVLISIAAYWQWQQGKHTYLLVWLAYLIALSPVSGIIQVGTQAAADRYAYLPTLGFYIAASYIGVTYYKQQKHVSIIIFGLLICFSWSQLSRQYIKVWGNEKKLWYYVLELYPDNHTAYRNLGTAYLANKKYSKALAYYHQAIKLAPQYLQYYNRLAHIYVLANNIPAAIQTYLYLLKKIQKLPQVPIGIVDIYFRLAILYQSEKLMSKAHQAIKMVLHYDNKHQAALDWQRQYTH